MALQNFFWSAGKQIFYYAGDCVAQENIWVFCRGGPTLAALLPIHKGFREFFVELNSKGGKMQHMLRSM